MKKLILGAVALMTAGTLMAGSVDYLSNQSADYLRTFSRNASLDADAAVYNPAGTAFFAPGLTFALSNQSVFKVYENDMDTTNAFLKRYDKEYKSTEPTYFLPNGQLVFNRGAWAAYLTSGVVAGGGTAVYGDGVPTMGINALAVGQSAKTKSGGAVAGAIWTSGNLTATSLYPQVTVGGSYALIDSLSVSAGLRYVYGLKTFKGEANYTFVNGSGVPITTPGLTGTVLKLDVVQSAQGIGGIVGVNWKAYQGLLVTMRVETPTPLEFATKVNDGNDFGGFFTDGKKETKDLPALAALGVRYDWNDLSVTASGTGFLLGLSRNGDYLKKYNDFGWETGLSAEYAFIPGLLKASVGGMITTVGGNKDSYTDFDFSLDSQSVGGGLVYTPMKDLDITVSASKTFYTSSAGNYQAIPAIGLADYTTTYKKDAFTVNVGVQYKLF